MVTRGASLLVSSDVGDDEEVEEGDVEGAVAPAGTPTTWCRPNVEHLVGVATETVVAAAGVARMASGGGVEVDDVVASAEEGSSGLLSVLTSISQSSSVGETGASSGSVGLRSNSFISSNFARMASNSSSMVIFPVIFDAVAAVLPGSEKL